MDLQMFANALSHEMKEIMMLGVSFRNDRLTVISLPRILQGLMGRKNVYGIEEKFRKIFLAGEIPEGR